MHVHHERTQKLLIDTKGEFRIWRYGRTSPVPTGRRWDDDPDCDERRLQPTLSRMPHIVRAGALLTIEKHLPRTPGFESGMGYEAITLQGGVIVVKTTYGDRGDNPAPADLTGRKIVLRLSWDESSSHDKIRFTTQAKHFQDLMDTAAS